MASDFFFFWKTYCSNLKRQNSEQKPQDASYRIGRSISVGSDKLIILIYKPVQHCGLAEKVWKWKCHTKRLYHQIPPTSTLPLRFPLKLNRHPWDISNLKYLFKGQHWSWLLERQYKKEDLARTSKTGFILSWKGRKVSQMVALTTSLDKNDGNTGIVENFPLN